jgi:hypothetical protein
MPALVYRDFDASLAMLPVAGMVTHISGNIAMRTGHRRMGAGVLEVRTIRKL